MKPWRVAGCFVGAFVLGSLIFWPAWTITEFANRHLMPFASLESPQGTVWHGASQIRPMGSTSAFPVKWDFQPAELLKLSASWRLTLPGPLAKGQAQVNFSLLGFMECDVDLEVPAHVFSLRQASPVAGQGGKLHISGHGEWTRALGLRFDGTLTPPTNPPPEMQVWLASLGQPVDGHYSLSYRNNQWLR